MKIQFPRRLLIQAAVFGSILMASSATSFIPACAQEKPIVPFPGTAPLTMEGDITSELVDGVDRFLLKKLEETDAQRIQHWQRENDSETEAFLTAKRNRLSHILGLRDARIPFEKPEVIQKLGESAAVGRSSKFSVLRVRWPAFGDVYGEGLLFEPNTGGAVGNIIAIPDADVPPESIALGFGEATPQSQYARQFAENGYRVLVPMLIDRRMEKRLGRANLSSREFLHRSAFELGRHLAGYEVQKCLAGVDWFKKAYPATKVGVVGWGEGGMLALYAGAVDTRIDGVLVSGYFRNRREMWQEPIDRSVYSRLVEFGDAELVVMLNGRSCVIDACKHPEVNLPSEGGAPATLKTPPLDEVVAEFARVELVSKAAKIPSKAQLIQSEQGAGLVMEAKVLQTFSKELAPKVDFQITTKSLEVMATAFADIHARQLRQMHEIDRHNQWLLSESPYVRSEFMKNLDTSSVAKYEESVEKYRQIFRDETIGDFKLKLPEFNARSRLAYETEKWKGYEVVLDVAPDVFAYGILLWPNDIKPGEKRPVVVCQHGLEGRPQDIVTGNHEAYHDFAAKLAERGFITFAPQNIYIFKDRFRTLQRKSYPMQKTLFSVMVPQHQQIVNWLKSMPEVDEKRIGFYGLSYGGKSAMRIPALVTDYALSICSADFNEWVWKNASSRAPYSYVWTGEYEIFEFDLGSTFNYAEMAALIAPRPFMVERGHFDGVAPDETVAYEFAKVRNLYQARLKLQGMTEIEWFVGPHTINGQGTYEFLHRHLNWPKQE